MQRSNEQDARNVYAIVDPEIPVTAEPRQPLVKLPIAKYFDPTIQVDSVGRPFKPKNSIGLQQIRRSRTKPRYYSDSAKMIFYGC